MAPTLDPSFPVIIYNEFIDCFNRIFIRLDIGVTPAFSTGNVTIQVL